jgi:hypothetical protein
MDQHHVTTWTRSVRSVPSRRDVLRGLAAAALGFGALRLPDTAAAKKKRKKTKKQTCRPNCVDRTCGNDGCDGSCGACASDQACHGGICCVPDSRGDTCAGRCGTRTNNCGQPVVCTTCAAGQKCLSNGSCAIVCTDNVDCPSTCDGCSNPSVEGERHCIAGLLVPQVLCTSTTDCPPGAHCQELAPGVAVCISVCH